MSAFSDLIEGRAVEALERIATALERSATISERHYAHVMDAEPVNRRVREASAVAWERMNARPEPTPMATLDVCDLIVRMFEEYDRRRAGE